MAINYRFFGLQHPAAWDKGFGPLWNGLWQTYVDGAQDPALLEVAAPFLAWRALVLASPRWYPQFPAVARDKLLTFIEQALEAGAFDPATAEALFR